MRSSRVKVVLALLAVLARPAVAADRPAPLERRVPGATKAVVVLHGLSLTAKHTEKQTGLTRVGVRHGFDVVYPSGIRGSWNADWCCGWARDEDVDDVGYLAELIRQIRARGIRQVYLAGFSNGGMMAYRYACALGPAGGVDGVLTVGGTYESSQTCYYTGHVVHVHGLLDRTVPYDGLDWSDYLRAPIRAVPTIQGIAPFMYVDVLAVERGGHAWPRQANAALVDVFGL